jgi:hypothetical protein
MARRKQSKQREEDARIPATDGVLLDELAFDDQIAAAYMHAELFFPSLFVHIQVTGMMQTTIVQQTPCSLVVDASLQSHHADPILLAGPGT